MKIFRVDHKEHLTVTTIDLSKDKPVQFEGLTLDLNKSTISCRKEKADQILQYIAFSFSVALLHVLCVPRPSNWKPGRSLSPKKSTRRGDKYIERFPDETMAFMTAAGLLYLTPSNHYIYNTHGPNVCAGCSAGGLVAESCGIGFDQNQCVINSDGGDVGGGDGGVGCGGGCGGCSGCGGCGGGCGGCGGA